MTDEAATHLAGDYRLIELLSENDVSRVWLGEQVSIGRRVLVEELRPDRADKRAEFMANARAKAAVDHPLIASVYEAVADQKLCFFARERLHPHTLAGLLQAGHTMEPARIARILRLLADAQLHHEAASQPTEPPTPDHIHVDEHEVVRIDNLALAGTRDPGQSAKDIARLGAALPRLVADARPGTSRVLTLLSWMRGEGIDTTLDWRQVADICSQIEAQLSNPPAPADSAAGSRKCSHRLPKWAAAGALIGLLVVLVLAWVLRPEKQPAAKPAPKPPESVAISAGTHPSPDGGEHQMDAFRIATQPVSIAQYADFLDVLRSLSKNGLERSFDHREQPAEKTTHEPDDWAQQLKTPRQLPVVGIDWWDAVAYAEWKKSRLPSQEQWYAAWRDAATRHQPFASSIREWTSAPAIDPANPLGGAKWVLVGCNSASAGPLARQWIENRLLREKGLGFRVVSAAPNP